MDTALHYFGQALERDPKDALAHVGTYLVWAWQRQFGVTPPQVATPAMRGALDAALALDWRERAYEARDPNLPYIGSGEAIHDAVRDHGRFQTLRQRMNLPPSTRQ